MQGPLMEAWHGVKVHTSTMVDGRKVPRSMYYVGRGNDGQMQTSAKPHNATLMTEALANLLVTNLNNTGHHAEVCELLCDENSTIHHSLVDIGEETPAPAPAPTSLVELGRAIENCFRQGLSPLEVLNHCNKTVLLGCNHEDQDELRAGNLGFAAPFPLVIVILTKLVDFVVLAIVAIFAIFPNVASAGIEERVVTPAIRELDTGVLSLRHGGLRLK